MDIHTYDPGRNKMVKAGTLSKDVYTKRVNDKHFMVLEQGYGIQEDVMADIENAGCKTIRLICKRNVYHIPFETWKKKGRRSNYGHGTQVFLNKKYYEV
jgi:hypothetical protein